MNAAVVQHHRWHTHLYITFHSRRTGKINCTCGLIHTGSPLRETLTANLKWQTLQWLKANTGTWLLCYTTVQNIKLCSQLCKIAAIPFKQWVHSATSQWSLNTKTTLSDMPLSLLAYKNCNTVRKWYSAVTPHSIFTIWGNTSHELTVLKVNPVTFTEQAFRPYLLFVVLELHHIQLAAFKTGRDKYHKEQI